MALNKLLAPAGCSLPLKPEARLLEDEVGVFFLGVLGLLGVRTSSSDSSYVRGRLLVDDGWTGEGDGDESSARPLMGYFPAAILII